MLWLSELGLCQRGVRRRRKAGSKNKTSCFFVILLHMAITADDTASSLQKSTSPAIMFTSRLVLPSALTWTEKSACVANLPRSHKHTRARFLLLLCDVAVLLRLVVVQQLLY